MGDVTRPAPGSLGGRANESAVRGRERGAREEAAGMRREPHGPGWREMPPPAPSPRGGRRSQRPRLGHPGAQCPPRLVCGCARVPRFPPVIPTGARSAERPTSWGGGGGALGRCQRGFVFTYCDCGTYLKGNIQ